MLSKVDPTQAKTRFFQVYLKVLSQPAQRLPSRQIRMCSEFAFHFNSIIGDTPMEKVGSAGGCCLISDLSILQMCFYEDEGLYTNNLNLEH